MEIYLPNNELENIPIESISEKIRHAIVSTGQELLEKPTGFLSSITSIAESLPGYPLGIAASVFHMLGLMGLFGETAYRIAMTHQQHLSELLFLFFNDEALAKNIINFYLQNNSLRIDAADVGVGSTLFVANHCVAKLFEKILTIKAIQELSTKTEITANDSRVEALIKEWVSLKREAVIQGVVTSFEFLAGSPIAFAGLGNAILGFGYHLNGLQKIIPMVMTGSPYFPNYHAVKNVDYGVEVDRRITEFQDIRNLNTHHFQKIT